MPFCPSLSITFRSILTQHMITKHPSQSWMSHLEIIRISMPTPQYEYNWNARQIREQNTILQYSLSLLISNHSSTEPHVHFCCDFLFLTWNLCPFQMTNEIVFFFYSPICRRGVGSMSLSSSRLTSRITSDDSSVKNESMDESLDEAN